MEAWRHIYFLFLLFQLPYREQAALLLVRVHQRFFVVARIQNDTDQSRSIKFSLAIRSINIILSFLSHLKPTCILIFENNIDFLEATLLQHLERDGDGKSQRTKSSAPLLR